MDEHTTVLRAAPNNSFDINFELQRKDLQPLAPIEELAEAELAIPRVNTKQRWHPQDLARTGGLSDDESLLVDAYLKMPVAVLPTKYIARAKAKSPLKQLQHASPQPPTSPSPPTPHVMESSQI